MLSFRTVCVATSAARPALASSITADRSGGVAGIGRWIRLPRPWHQPLGPDKAPKAPRHRSRRMTDAGTNTLLMVCQGKPDQLSGKVASDLHTYFNGLFSV